MPREQLLNICDYLCDLFYLLGDVPFLQKFSFKTCDIYVVKHHTISATLGFTTTQSLSEFTVTVWAEMNEEILQIRHYPNHHFDGYFAASITHCHWGYFTSSNWNEEIDSTAQYSKSFLLDAATLKHPYLSTYCKQ